MNTFTPKKIVLLGPFGFGNLGDAAIQQAMIQNILRYFPNAELFGISMRPEDTEKRHGLPTFPIGRIAWGWGLNKPPERSNFFRLLYGLRFETPSFIQKIIKALLFIPSETIGFYEAFQFLKDKDMLIISGGGQLDDFWGGAWAHPYTLMTWGLLTKLRNIPYKFVSVGAGPLDSRLSRIFDKVALTLADYRSYRDEKSKIYIEKVTGFVHDDPVYPDLAFSLTGIEPYYSHSKNNRSLLVGIGPLTYFHPQSWPDKDLNIYLGYLTKLAKFTQWLINQQYKVLFFPGDFSDIEVINDLKKLLLDGGYLTNLDDIQSPAIETVGVLLEQLACVDIAITSRFHGVLLSLLLNKPLIALSYHSKIDELMIDTGQAQYCLQIHDFELETLKTLFTKLEATKEIASQQIAERVHQYRTALDGQYEQIFGSL